MDIPQDPDRQAEQKHSAELNEAERDALRAEAERSRAQADAYAAVLEDIAVNGLPRVEDCTPWEEIRETLWERHEPRDDGQRVA